MKPGRGIRQGDLLSPYLFFICSKDFSNLLQRSAENKRLKGLKISRQGPVITYLLFADYDTLVFCKANESNAQKLKEILHQYKESSGQSINLEKSSVIFNKNIKNDQKKKICEILGGIQAVSQGKYLGLPMVVTRTKDYIFGFIKDNVKEKLHNWKNKLLSVARKKVMLKAVIMAMPTYAMSCFKLSARLYKEITAMMASY